MPGFLKRGHTMSAAELGLSLPRQPARHALAHRDAFDIVDVFEEGGDGQDDPITQMHAAWAKGHVPVGRQLDEMERLARNSLSPPPSSPKATNRASQKNYMRKVTRATGGERV